MSGRPDSVPRLGGIFLWLLRILASAYFALLLWQVTLAGLFVGGDVGMLALHAQNAQNLAIVLVASTIAAALFAWTARGARWPFWCLLPLIGLVGLQFHLGYARSIPAHVGLGTALFALSALVIVGVWRIRYVRRPRRRDPAASDDGASREAAAPMEAAVRGDGIRTEDLSTGRDES